MNEVIKNIANKTKTATPSVPAKIQENIVKPTFVPIKEKIKKMEQGNEKSEFEMKFKEVTTHKEIKNTENANIVIEAKYENGSNGSTNNNQEEDRDVPPPKPLPRTSRNNSITEQPSPVVNEEGPRPVARPRTSAAGYKVSFFLAHNIV